MIPALDLFCGMGGWSTGAARSGHIDVRAALDLDADALEAIKCAHPRAAPIQRDALGFPYAELRDAVGGGWLLASPVCKDVSPAGKPATRGTGGNGTVNLSRLAESRRDARNTAQAVINAAEALEPETILVENSDRWADWALFRPWCGMLEALGYKVRAHVINAADYGAAIDRPRTIVTARKGVALDLAPEWNGGRSNGQCIANCLDLPGHSDNRWHLIDSKPTRTRNLIRTKQRESGQPCGLLNNVGDGVRLRPFSDLAPSFTTQSGTQLMIVDGDRVRIINPREQARIMGWTDSEADALPKNRKTCSRLIGNAISPTFTSGAIAQALVV